MVSRVREDKVSGLRRWIAELTDRRDEVLESLRAEGMHHEKAYLVEHNDGPLLIYVTDADDIDAAGEAYLASDLAVDRDHARSNGDGS